MILIRDTTLAGCEVWGFKPLCLARLGTLQLQNPRDRWQLAVISEAVHFGVA
jgi:hypothetical protein